MVVIQGEGAFQPRRSGNSLPDFVTEKFGFWEHVAVRLRDIRLEVGFLAGARVSCDPASDIGHETVDNDFFAKLVFLRVIVVFRRLAVVVFLRLAIRKRARCGEKGSKEEKL